MFKKKVLLFNADVDKEFFKEHGKENSSMIKIHPYIKLLNQDIQNEIKEHLNIAIDLIRDNLDVSKL